MSDPQRRADAIVQGDRRMLAQALTTVERGGADARAMVRCLPALPEGRVIGITGAPGAGKSTLTTALAQAFRARGMTVAIIAVDPSSPLTGGSLLGDRIRMYDLAGDSGVFIRSMANRGRFGGIAAATADAMALMTAAGFAVILIETVGAGQSDVAVADVADTILLVEAPGMGDEVQSIKAGLLEVADVIAVSKSDRADAAATLQQLRALVQMQHPSNDAWPVAVCGVSALQQTGIEELTDALLAHRSFLATHPHTARALYRRRMSLQRAIEVQLYEAVGRTTAWQSAHTLLTHDASIDIDVLAQQILAEWRRSAD
ncbi:MAG: methylmalonyl Co-A mutase-associated GTPase MeaB [Roseiflexaceae bacterium]